MIKKIKIALYSGVVPSTTFIERLIDGLSQEGNKIFLFGNKTKNITYNSNVIISTYGGRANKFFRLVWFSCLLLLFKNNEKKKLDKWIKNRNRNTNLLKIKCYPILWHKPDIFHLQWVKSIEDWIWVKEFGIKLVISLRGSQITIEPNYNNDVKILYNDNFYKVDGFHAVSEAISKEAQKYGANPEKINVVYSGLPENNFTFKTKQQNNSFKIVSIGRNHWVKGYTYALETMKILSDKGFDFHYTIVGAKDSEEIEFLKNDLNLNDSVALKGKVSFSEVQQLMYNSDLLLLPSLEEGIANVVLEAMQIGTLVLTTDCGGMEEVINNQENGFIVPMRSPEKMAESILMISELSEGEKHEITENAKNTIRNNHTTQTMVSGMINLYKNVLN